MRWDDNGSRFEVDLQGTITFTDDLTDVQSLSDGGSFRVRDWTGSVVPHTVKITAAGGTITREYFVGGLSRGWDDEGRRFLAGHLPVLVRRARHEEVVLPDDPRFAQLVAREQRGVLRFDIHLQGERETVFLAR